MVRRGQLLLHADNSFEESDKEEIEEYLKASGVASASLHLGSFAKKVWT
jgi:hypothetical protein